MATNLELQKQLNDLSEAYKNILEFQNKLIKNQGELLGDVVLKAQSVNFKNASSEAKLFSQSLSEMASEAGKAAKSSQSFHEMIVDGVGESIKGTEGLTKTFRELNSTVKEGTVVTEFFSGLKQGMMGVVTVGKSVLSIAGGAVKTLGHLALSVISFPFAMLKSLIHSASQGGGDNSLRTELESIRKEFGYLNKTAGGTIITLGRSLKGELANTGLSVRRIFGSLAERLKFFHEYATGLGETMDAVMRTFDPRKDAEALGAFNKALGLTVEGQKAIGQRTIASGKSINETNREIANYAIQLSSAFGVTMKDVSRDVGKMMADFTHFGHLGVKELSQVSVYTKRLGLDFKQLGAVMDKFTNFEDAAQGAAQLSQAFGLNIDAFKLMKEQDPAKKMEMLRKSFFAAGRSIETMTYQERRLLAQQTGLDDAAVTLAFSMKNQGLSYDQVAKKGDQAKKKQLTQAEALEKLSGAIERLVMATGSGGSGGFLDRFMRGFEVGIRRSREFRAIMHNLRSVLQVTFRAGVQVGRAFVESFPGIKQWFKGIAGIFERGRFKKMLGSIVGAFREFFTDLQTDPRAGFKKFVEKMKIGFTDWFDSRSPNGQKMLTGFKSFFKAFAGIFAEGLKMAIQGVAKAMTFITDLILHPEKLKGVGKAGAGATSFVGSLFVPIINAIVEAWPQFRDAFVGLMKAVLPKIGNAMKSMFAKAWPAIAAAIFGPAMSRSILAALSSNLVGAIGKGAAGIGSSLINSFKKTSSSIEKASQTAGIGKGGTLSADSAKNMDGFFQKIGKIKVGDVIKAGFVMVAIAGALAVGGYLMAIGIKKIANEIKDIPRQTLIASMGVLTLTALITIPLVKAFSKHKSTDLASAASTVLAVSLLLGVIGGASILLIAGFKALGNVKPRTVFTAMLAMGAMATLVRFAILPLVKTLSEQKIEGHHVATAMLAISVVIAALAATAVGLVYAFDGMQASIKTVGVAMAAMAGMTLIFGGVLQLAKNVEKNQIKDPGSLLLTFGAIGLIVTEIAAVSWIATNLLGELPISAIISAGFAIGVMTGLFYLMIPLVKAASKVGESAKSEAANIAVGMVTLGLSIIAVGASLGIIGAILGSINQSTLKTATDAIYSMMGVFYAVTPLIVIAAGIGAVILETAGTGAAALVIGMAVLGISVVAIAESAKLLISATKGIDITAVLSAGAMITALAGVFTMVGAAVGIAAAIGAAVMLTLGAGAIAIAVGMEVMNQGVNSIIEGAKNLIANASKITVTADIKEKTNLVLEVVKVIAGFAPALTKALDILKPSLSELVFGRQSDTGALMKSFSDMMTSLTGNIQNLLGTIMNMVKGFSGLGNADQIRVGTEAISKIMASVADFVKAAASASGSQGSGGFLSDVVGSLEGAGRWLVGKKSQAEENVANLIQTMFAVSLAVKPLIQSIFQLTKELMESKNITEQGLKGAEVIGNIIQAVSGMLNALTPSKEFLQAAGNFKSLSSDEGLKSGLQPGMLREYGDVMKNNFEGIGGVIQKVSESVQNIIPIVQSVDIKDLEKLKFVGPLITAITEMSKGVSTAIAALASVAVSGGGGNANRFAIEQIINKVSDTMSAIGTKLGQTVNDAMTSLSGIKNVSGARAKLGILKDMFEILGSLSGIFANFSKARGKSESQFDDVNAVAMNTNIMNVASALDQLLSMDKGGIYIAQAIKAISGSAKFDPKPLKDKLGIIKSLFETLGLIPNLMSALTDGKGKVSNPQQIALFIATTMLGFIGAMAVITNDFKGANPFLAGRMDKMFGKNFTGIPKTAKDKLTSALDGVVLVMAEIQKFSNLKIDNAQLYVAQSGINTTLGVFKNVLTESATNISNITSALPDNFFALETKSISVVSDGLIKMVDKVNNISAELASMKAADITVGLKNVANVLGVKNEQLTLNYKNFTLAVNVNVQVDAAQLETAIVDRKLSRVQTRPVQGLPPFKQNR